MGVGKGIHPGRVSWAHQAKATSWDGTNGNWWEDAYSDQRLVDEMVSETIRLLAGEKSDKRAWVSLFQQFNETHGGGKNGYRPGEKIAIKWNGVQDQPGDWRKGGGLPSPHVTYAMIHQLITVAGVRGKTLSYTTPRDMSGTPCSTRSRPIPIRISRLSGSTSTSASRAPDGSRWLPDKANPIVFSKAGVPTAYPPQCATEAKYLINVGLLRAHTLMGVTATAKNHFGSVDFDDVGFSPRPLHDFASRDLAMGSYNCLVDLIAHNHLGGKTMLFMIDGLYASEHNMGGVIKYKSFGDHWASSLFASQDPVAIDSVALDFIRNEPNNAECRGKPENYLHEAALAEKPPSGTVYDSDRDGKPVTSLGVHEHWNNPTDKQYSRNLGKRDGIELVAWPDPIKTRKA